MGDDPGLSGRANVITGSGSGEEGVERENRRDGGVRSVTGLCWL